MIQGKEYGYESDLIKLDIELELKVQLKQLLKVKQSMFELHWLYKESMEYKMYYQSIIYDIECIVGISFDKWIEHPIYSKWINISAERF